MPDKRNDNKDLIGKKAMPTPAEQPEIGADLGDELINELVDEIDSSQYTGVDLGALEGFSGKAQTREQIYALIDTMAADDRIKAILDTYTEDTIETNESGQIVWCESSDDNVLKYVNYLLGSLQVDSHSEDWVRSLIKYGDLYLRLFRQSDYDEEDLFSDSKDERDDYNKTLNEAYDLDEESHERLDEGVRVNVHSADDHYVHYVEKVDNPAEMFELTKLGSTRGYIKAPTAVQSNYDELSQDFGAYVSYKMQSKDVEVYSATDFVHLTIDSNSSRSPEQVQIFRDEESEKSGKGLTYKVNKGQSLLYSQFKIWRELSLLENSVILNRLTRSAIVRILNVEVGDMPKEKAMSTVSRIKQNIEQKSAFKVGASMTEYPNPGPIENAIYIPTHEGKGAITATTLGGDYDPKQLTDLDYFQNKLYGAFRVPKQYFNNTDDGGGFNGGSALTIISSRYGKAVKAIQKAYCNGITNLINILLWDKGLKGYINKFTIKMQTPLTQEELDRRENMRNRMGVNNDVMSLVNGVVEDDVIKAKIAKSLLSQSLTNPEVISLMQEHIDNLEKAREEAKDEGKEEEPSNENPPLDDFPSSESGPSDFEREIGFSPEPEGNAPEEPLEEPSSEPDTNLEAEPEGIAERPDSWLPSPNDLGMDFTNNQ